MKFAKGTTMEKIKGYEIIVFCADCCAESYRLFLAENLQQTKNFIKSKLAKRNAEINFFNNGNGEFEKYFVDIVKNGENAFKDFNGFAKNFIKSKLAKRNAEINFFNNGNGEFEKYFVDIVKNGENAFKDFNGFDIREVWVESSNFFKHNRQYFFQTQKDEICQLNY